MKRILNIALLGTLCAGCQSHEITTHEVSEGVLIQNVSLISAERESPSAPMDVWIRDGKIMKIGNDLSPADQTIDGSGSFLTPGLVDGHTHLTDVPGMTGEHEAAFPEIAKAARAQIPRSYLYHGFTTLVDLNSGADAIKKWNAAALHPKAYFCGGAPVFDGYPTQFMPKNIRYKAAPNFLYDGVRADDFPKGVDPADHSPEAVVERIHNEGAICVKTHYESGFGGRDMWPVPSVQLIQKLVTAAHDKGMPVLLHANSQSAQTFGVEAGVDAFAHGMWTWDTQDTKLSSGVKQILDASIAKGIAVQPTVQVLHGERDLQRPDYLERAELKAVLPQSLMDWYKSDDGKWWQTTMRKNPYIASAVKEGRYEDIDAEPILRVTETMTYLDTHGGKLLFGSDTPSEPTYANPAGFNGRLEMQNWMETGITPAVLFRAMTLGNAEFFGLEKEIGSIEEGKRADLLLMSKNPLVSVEAYDSIETVIVSGKVASRESLSAQ